MMTPSSSDASPASSRPTTTSPRSRNWRRWYAPVSAGYHALLASWPVHGFRKTGAAHLSAILAYNALVAVVPTTLLLVSIAGLLLQRDAVMATVTRTAYWALPTEDARQALEAALSARQRSGWFFVASLLIFLWIGSGFAGALHHCFNRVYGVEDCDFVCSRQKGLAIVGGFAILFSLATLAAILPTLFIKRELAPYFQSWALADTAGQIASYAAAVLAASSSFWMLYRVAPSAGQKLRDTWPGALVAGVLFVVIGQVFPVYFRMTGGANRYGVAFGLLTLLVAWFAVLAHILLFGCYVNATYRAHRYGIPSGPKPDAETESS